ncbi:MAG TPA: hypothetical protein VF765_31640 [Polyangiaceae bacterium]
MHRGVWVMIALVACGREVRKPVPTAAPTATPTPTATTTTTLTTTATATTTATPTPKIVCKNDPSFPSPWNVPEASGAAEVELRRGAKEILVISDSGRHGAAMVWSAAGGMRALTLAVDDAASDDFEGVTWMAPGRLYTLTSSGAVRTYVPDGSGGLRAEGPAYAIGAPPLSCPDLHGINCGKNYEGLCLRASGASGRCAGYAASKRETALYCVERDASGRLSIDASKPALHLDLARITSREGVLSDCAFGAEGGPAQGVLLVTTNVFGGSSTYVVDEATGRATQLDMVTTPSNEAIAVDHEGAFYAFMDDNGDKSLALRFTCSGW